MNQELERIGKILVEAEGGCWHSKDLFEHNTDCGGGYWICYKCHQHLPYTTNFNADINPDFSSWENFGRVLKIAEKKNRSRVINEYVYAFLKHAIGAKAIDNVPTLVSSELARILEEK